MWPRQRSLGSATRGPRRSAPRQELIAPQIESLGAAWLVNHGCSERNGWNTLSGSMRVEASVFVSVLEYEDYESSDFRYPWLLVFAGILNFEMGWLAACRSLACF